MASKMQFAQQIFADDSYDVPEVVPFHVDIDAVRVRFKNGEEVIVTQSFSEKEKYDLWLSARDPFKASQILSGLEKDEAAEWLKAVNYRVLHMPF